jgi:hypothetical protein
MRALPAITARSGRFLIGLLLCVKLLLLVWNAVVYDGRTYDASHHADRAVFGGLKPGALAYDPPLYYLPALLVPKPADIPRIERDAPSDGAKVARSKRSKSTKAEQAFRELTLDVLRYTNLIWIGFFYVAWIGYAFPRLLRDRRSWFLASLLLLAIPGYQKLAAMSHPDNAFAAGSALVVCAWLRLREGWLTATTGASLESSAGRAARYLPWLALAIGIVGLTRPLAVVYVAVFTALALVYAARISAGHWRAFAPRALLVLFVVGVMSGAWYGVRYRHSGALLASLPDQVVEENRPLRAEFPYARYLTSFYPGLLWETPNHALGELEAGGDLRTSHANSLPTLMHSEVWGDHWLSFSGPKGKDNKAWAKRVSLLTAVLMPLLVPLLFVGWAYGYVRRAKAWARETFANGLERRRSAAEHLEPQLVLLALCALGAASFLSWQMGVGLMPGHNTSVRFAYVAPFFPPLLALLFSRPLERLLVPLLVGYFLLLYCAAFPVAMFWPS